jgi:predicted O-methyltransferase YrrM
VLFVTAGRREPPGNVTNMTPRTEHLSAELHRYLVANGTPPDGLLRELAAETQETFPEHAGMQIAPEQGAFMTILARLLGARFVVEVGTFTGYSALAMARGLADGGWLLCCDVNEEYAAVARKYWARAGVEDRVELVLAPALETLRRLPAEPTIDLSFIDADKEGYVDYWEEIVPRTRPNGVILVDNTLSHGRVVNPAAHHHTAVQGILRFNERARTDDRVELVMLPIGDGLTFARKR